MFLRTKNSWGFWGWAGLLTASLFSFSNFAMGADRFLRGGTAVIDTEASFGGENVALKTVNERTAEPGMAERMAEREAGNLRRLDDSGVTPKLRNYDQGSRQIAMELIKEAKPIGGTTATIGETVRLARQVISALKQTYDKGVRYHGDLTRRNILQDENGKVWLVDWALAGFRGTPSPEESGLPKMITPGYAPPELLRGRQLERKSDVYQLGAVLYELIAGVTVMGRETDTDERVYVAGMSKSVVDALLRPDPIQHPIWRVLQKALETSPRRRPTIDNLDLALSVFENDDTLLTHTRWTERQEAGTRDVIQVAETSSQLRVRGGKIVRLYPRDGQGLAGKNRFYPANLMTIASWQVMPAPTATLLPVQ